MPSLLTFDRTLDTDTALMLRVREGDDSESFAALVGRNRNAVIHGFWRMVRNETVARELAQDVFVRVYRARESYQPTAKFTTWLFRITANVARNYFRDEKRHLQNVSLDFREGLRARRLTVDHASLIEDHLLRREFAAQVRRAIRSLPPKQRAAVIMHKYLEMDYGQIGAELGCTTSAVKALMFRAYEALRFKLRRSEFHKTRESEAA